MAKYQTTEVSITSSFDEVEYFEDIQVHKEDFFITGFTFDVPEKDGYSTAATLYRCDKNLKIRWSLKIHETSKSEVKKISIFNNKIYALVVHGKDTNKTSETFLTFYIISLEGKIQKKIKIGDIFSTPTNMVFDGKKIFFAYPKSDRICYYDKNIKSLCALIEFDTETNRFNEKLGHDLGAYLPEKIILSNSVIYVVGTFETNFSDLVTEHFILELNNGKLKETILRTKKSEYFLDAYTSNDELVVLTTFPGVYSDKKNFIKFYYALHTTLKEKKIYYGDLNWEEITFDTFSSNETTWLNVTDKETKRNYIQIDRNGEIISKISLDKIQSYSKFIIHNQLQIQDMGDGQIKITNEPTINIKK